MICITAVFEPKVTKSHVFTGLNPIETVTELRAAHAAGAEGGAYSGAGVNVRRGRVTDMRHEHVLQPLHVTASALALSTETVRAILKIDDIVSASLASCRTG